MSSRQRHAKGITTARPHMRTAVSPINTGARGDTSSDDSYSDEFSDAQATPRDVLGLGEGFVSGDGDDVLPSPVTVDAVATSPVVVAHPHPYSASPVHSSSSPITDVPDHVPDDVLALSASLDDTTVSPPRAVRVMSSATQQQPQRVAAPAVPVTTSRRLTPRERRLPKPAAVHRHPGDRNTAALPSWSKRHVPNNGAASGAGGGVGAGAGAGGGGGGGASAQVAKGLTNQFSVMQPRGGKGKPVIRFTPVSTDDYVKVRKRRAAIARGEMADPLSTPRDPQLRSGKRGHVTNCTCSACRSAVKKKLHGKGPIKLYYRMNSSGIVLVHAMFKCHGFRQTRKDNFNVMWTSAHLKSYVFQGLRPHQKVNQFPRSYEVTRKDSLARNMGRMVELHGQWEFGFVPESFVLPTDRTQFVQACRRNSRMPWIVKPSTSSQGKGIFITQHSATASSGVNLEEETCTVSRYIDNPLLIDGKKFDLRIYVAVTSFNPLRIYIHEQGYDPSPEHYDNHFIHLTNYSINKYSDKFVANEDPDADDVGHKWSLPALWRRLRESGVDIDRMQALIDDLIIKTMISIEPTVTTASDMFVPYDNCFELFGFDVMIDEDMQPWLLEVNFSPSLNCDAPLDHRIKSGLVADLLTLVGIEAFDTAKAEWEARKRQQAAFHSRGSKFTRSRSSRGRKKAKKPPPQRGGDNFFDVLDPGAGRLTSRPEFSTSMARRDDSTEWAHSGGFMGSLSAKQRRVVRETIAEDERSGAFRRIFPSAQAYTYRKFFEEVRPLNDLLADHLFHITAQRNSSLHADAPTADSTSDDAPIMPSRASIRLQQAKAQRRLRRSEKKGRSAAKKQGRVAHKQEWSLR